MDDVPILEVYSRERAAHLSAELYLLDRRKLTKEAQAGIKVAYQRLAHGHLGEWRLRCGGVGAFTPYDLVTHAIAAAAMTARQPLQCTPKARDATVARQAVLAPRHKTG